MKSLAVIIARFQAPDLTVGHLSLIEQAAAENDQILILLGVPPVPGRKHDPLTYTMRVASIFNSLRGPLAAKTTVAPLPDMADHGNEWTRHVDTLIAAMFPLHAPCLYGGRDSCLEYYLDDGGRFPTTERETIDCPSATEVREAIEPIHTSDFRAGVIWATQNRFNSVLPVVDMAIFRGENILLARKPTDAAGKWRLIGGFVDAQDASYEAAAIREVREETGLEVGNATYAGSCTITDWRYRGGPESIKSSVFVLDYIFGSPEAADDISEVRWFPVHEAMARISTIHEEALQLAIARHENTDVDVDAALAGYGAAV